MNKNSFLTNLLIFILIHFTNSACWALDPSSLLGPLGFQKTQIAVSSLYHDTTQFKSDKTAVAFNNFDFSMPLFRAQQESVSLKLKGDQLSLQNPLNNYSDFSAVNLNLGYSKILDQSKIWSVSARYGSASDKIFANNSVITYGMTGFYTYADDLTSRWVFLIDYANDRPILNNLPLPGLAYIYSPSKDFRVILGAPFSMLSWGFAENFSMDVTTIVPWVLKSTLNYKINDFSSLYGGFDFSQETYFLADRAHSEDRFFYDEKKLYVGTKFPINKTVLAEFELGHAFDRKTFVAESYSLDPSNSDSFANAFFAKLGLKAAF